MAGASDIPAVVAAIQAEGAVDTQAAEAVDTQVAEAVVTQVAEAARAVEARP